MTSTSQERRKTLPSEDPWRSTPQKDRALVREVGLFDASLGKSSPFHLQRRTCLLCRHYENVSSRVLPVRVPRSSPPLHNSRPTWKPHSPNPTLELLKTEGNMPEQNAATKLSSNLDFPSKNSTPKNLGLLRRLPPGPRAGRVGLPTLEECFAICSPARRPRALASRSW